MEGARRMEVYNRDGWLRIGAEMASPPCPNSSVALLQG